jgi:hypothetical protein
MTSDDSNAPWALREGSVSGGEVLTYCALRGALLRKEQVVALHKGLFLAFCPLVLGVSRGRRVVLGYSIIAEAATDPDDTGPHLPPRWRLLAVHDLQIISTSRGLWPLCTETQLLLDGFTVDVRAD